MSVRGRRTVPLDPDTFDICATNPTGWRCVVQGKSLTGGGYAFSEGPGQTVVCGSTTTNVPTVTMTTSPTTITYPAVDCSNTITTTVGATVENNAVYTINGSVSGNCSDYWCGDFQLTGYFEIECSISNKHCPLATVTDVDTNLVVSSTSPPSAPPTPHWIVGLQKNSKWQRPEAPEPIR